jgi:hypothetical protein
MDSYNSERQWQERVRVIGRTMAGKGQGYKKDNGRKGSRL